MPFDARELFANLAEKEKIKGHHSPEGRAIRVLSRALNGWASGGLSSRDVVALCNQAVEDWLKARLKRSPWSAQTTTALLAAGVKHHLISRLDAVRLQKIANLGTRGGDERISKAELENALEVCTRVIERHW
jgi:hypothetical protein